jgi:hypothetical protein
MSKIYSNTQFYDTLTTYIIRAIVIIIAKQKTPNTKIIVKAGISSFFMLFNPSSGDLNLK